MTWRRRRRGVFEGPPRVLYRRTGPRYVDAAAVATVVNGVVVAGFGVVTLVLYVDVDAAELALFAGCSAAGYIARLVREGAAGDLQIGVGVNSGRVVVGTVGGGGRRDFTVIGDPVNTAARVEAATRLTGDDILITETTLRALGPHVDGVEERPSIPLKGKNATVRLYAPRSDI